MTERDSHKMRRISLARILVATGLALMAAAGIFLAGAGGAIGWLTPLNAGLRVERADATHVIVVPPPTRPPAARVTERPSTRSEPSAIPTPVHAVTANLSSSDARPTPTDSGPLRSFDFLQDYVTNQTYPTLRDETPWTNSSVRIQQYQQRLGGVTYWDFWSELENWDSPAYMFQDDSGQWHPYQTTTVQMSDGQEAKAYLLVDRNGPGVMDKIWFTEDAVWMLSTAESSKNVGPIPDMNDFLEWGNLETLGDLRIEVDDAVAFDGPIKDWFSGKALGLTPELAQILTWRHRQYGSNGSIVPIPYQRHLRVLLHGGSKKPKWFMATGGRFPESTRVRSFTASEADLSPDELTRLAKNILQPETYIDSLPGEESFDVQAAPGAPARVRLDGAGTVAALQFQISKEDDPGQLWLKVTYGDEVEIDLPLVAFFGDHNYLVLHRSTPIGIVETPVSFIFYSNLPLPFQDGMVIELDDRGTRPIGANVRLAGTRATGDTRLQVLYRPEEKLTVYGPDDAFDLPGNGKLVGLVLVSEDQGLDQIPRIPNATDPNAEDPDKRAWPMGYLEGNLSLVDGTGRGRLYGGHEDWADSGFYFNRGYTNPPGGSNRPFGGILRYKDGADGYATIFRYFDDLSAFRFQNGLKVRMGHGTWDNNFPVSYGVTAYYYEETK